MKAPVTVVGRVKPTHNLGDSKMDSPFVICSHWLHNMILLLTVMWTFTTTYAERAAAVKCLKLEARAERRFIAASNLDVRHN